MTATVVCELPWRSWYRSVKDLYQSGTRRVPETCGVGHADANRPWPDSRARTARHSPTTQLRRISRQRAWQSSIASARRPWRAACTPATATTPPQPARCRAGSGSRSLRHSANASLFDGSKHKHAFYQHNWPERGQCQYQAIAKTHDSMLAMETEVSYVVISSLRKDAETTHRMKNCGLLSRYDQRTRPGAGRSLSRFWNE